MWDRSREIEHPGRQQLGGGEERVGLLCRPLRVAAALAHVLDVHAVAGGQGLLRAVQGIGEGLASRVPTGDLAGQGAHDRVRGDAPLQLLVERESAQDLGCP